MAVSAPSSAPVTLPSTRRRRRRAAGGLGLLGWCCVVVIAVALVLAVFGPLLAPYSPNAVNLGNAYLGPSGGHLLGFDSQGRDLLSRHDRRRADVGARAAGGGRSRHRRRHAAGARVGVVRWLARHRPVRGDGHSVRLPGDPARGARCRRVRRRPDRGRDLARDRLHPVRDADRAQRRAQGAKPALRGRARGAGLLRPEHLPQALAAGRRRADRRRDDDPVRLGDARPGRGLVPRARGAAARRPTGG